MSTQQARKNQQAEALLEDEAVAAYLEANPEFFERNSTLAAGLRIPHGPVGAISLIEHQVSLLRSQLQTERGRLAHLIARARDFETLSDRLHALVLQLIATPDLARVEAVLRESLCKEFDAEAVSLKLFPVEPDESDPLVNSFREFADSKHTLCGPLDAGRSQALFGDHSGKVQSAALIPIRGEFRCGVLAIGSSDPKRFGPDLGTDHLDRLAEVVSQKLSILGHQDA